jgi:hypothetical protein
MARSLSDLGVSSEGDGRESQAFANPQVILKSLKLRWQDSTSCELHKAKIIIGIIFLTNQETTLSLKLKKNRSARQRRS